MRTTQLRFERAEIIRASAGSGKTYVLVQRYIGLLLQGESPRSILASTFTVRAAAEIRERVLARLAHAVLDDQLRMGMEQEYHRTITPEVLRQTLARAVLELPCAAICTLDALVARVAGALPLECGLPLGWRLSELPGLSRDLERELVALQAQQLGSLLSMITRSDASRRIAQPLIDACLRFYSLLQTFGPRAFEIGQVETLPLPVSAWADLLSAMPLPQTKSKTPRFAFANGVEKIKWHLARDEPGELFKLQIIQRALERTSFDREDLSQSIYQPLVELARRVSVSEKNRLIERAQVLVLLLANFDALYRSHQAESGLVKHADLLLAVARHMANDALSSVAYALDQRFTHILLDEFQDTSPLQWCVLKPFLADVVSDAERDRSAFIVGDPKQAIYGWRGGSAAIFEEVTTTLPSAWHERTLAQSYRSSAVVLDFVNCVFSNLNVIKDDFAPVAARFRANFEPHQAKRELPGRVTMTVGEQPTSVWINSQLNEIFARSPFAKVGILTRKNDTVVEIVRDLRTAGVAAVGDGRAGSQRTLLVEAVKSLLQLSVHPADTCAAFLVQSSGLLRLEETVESASSWATTPALIRRLVELHDSAGLSREQVRDLELALVALSDGIERGANARELITALQVQALPGGKGQVSVMTMHRAKGLEFDCVLLPELDSKLIRVVPPSALTWREPDGTYRVTPYMNAALQRTDARFAAADREMQASEAYEAVCLLYVALTRAICELHLFLPPFNRAGQPGGEERVGGERGGEEKGGASVAAAPFSMGGVVAASLGLSLATPGVIFDTNVSV